MSFLEALRVLILGPIELILDVVFSVSIQITGNAGLSIVFMSLAINLLILPLYTKADAVQRKERDIAAKLKPGIDLIKETFTGDERFMILQTYYRQNHYKPYYVLRNSISLLLQIPFFMAAYHFLSNLQLIQGVPLGPIRNLGAPDGLLTLGGMTLNVLPILMTALNLISGAIYTKGFSLKSKIQTYGLALLFFVLLYRSPSGLVLYWTLNNAFSLAKNIFGKFKNPKRSVMIVCSLLGIVLAFAFFSMRQQLGTRKVLWGMIPALALQIPFIIWLLQKAIPKRNRNKETIAEEETVLQKPELSKAVFFSCCILLAILTGILIPSAVIRSSPAEFVEVGHYSSPLWYILNAFLLAAGTFLIWFMVYYLLAPKGKKWIYALFLAAVAVIALVNYLFFGNDYGNMSSLMRYDIPISPTGAQKLLNAGIMMLTGTAVWIFGKRRPAFLRGACMVFCTAVLGMSMVNIIAICEKLPEVKQTAQQGTANERDIIHLDKSGKNVVVIMTDRAIGALVPYLFQEHEELQEQFSGFVFYPNTLSYGGNTNTGSPPLYGGYDYVPLKINERSDVMVKDKQNEALKIMPVNFLENGYEVTVCDPPYANYSWIPDLTIYRDYPEIRTFLTKGMFQDTKESESIRKRNMFCYSILRIAPVAVHSELYDAGKYNQADASTDFGQNVISLSVSQGVSSGFMEAYRVLEKLPLITDIRDTGINTFCMIANGTTHDTMILQEPEYKPRENVDNTTYDQEHAVRVSLDGKTLSLTNLIQVQQYHSEMAAFLQIGKWLDYLRQEGVYNNTRIIIVADHGFSFGLPELNAPELGLDLAVTNPVLMVKDFDSQGAFSVDEQFMTNADTPTLAFQDLIQSPVNPYLQKEIANQDKVNREQVVCFTEWYILVNNGTVFMNPEYYALKGRDISEAENWSRYAGQ